jgi:hypothetical protein
VADNVKLKLNQGALQKIVKQEITKVGKELQSAADYIGRRYAGQPVPTVWAAIKRHPAFRDGPLTDKDLNAMAETIASGTHIEFRVR